MSSRAIVTTSELPGARCSRILDGVQTPLSPGAKESLAKWLAMVARHDFHNLPSIIATDAVFHSPVGLKPYPGRDLVCLMLRTAASVFEDFEYHREFVSGDSAVLEFSAHIGDIQLKAVHILRFNASGEIEHVEKMVRPIEAARALGNAMGSLIGAQTKVLRERARARKPSGTTHFTGVDA